MRVTLALLLLVLAARLMALHPQAEPVVQPSPELERAMEKETFEAVCGLCHGTDLVEGSLRTPAQFTELITTMQSYGASATPEQFAVVRVHMLRSFGKANVNSDTAADLAPVLDVEPEIAAAVVAHRERNGRFTSIDDLANVPGVDAEKLAARKDRLTF